MRGERCCFSSAVSGWEPENPLGSPRYGENFHSFLRFQLFPFPSCCLLGLGTRRQVLAAWDSRHTLVHVTLGSGCSWSLRALPEGCRGGTAPSPAQTSSTRLYLQKKGPHTKGRREHDQPRCVSLQLLNLSFLPLKTSQDNSWHVSSAFSISSRSLALGALLVHGAAVPAQGHSCMAGGGAGNGDRDGNGVGTDAFSLFRLAEADVQQVIINRANCCHPSSV